MDQLTHYTSYLNSNQWMFVCLVLIGISIALTAFLLNAVTKKRELHTKYIQLDRDHQALKEQSANVADSA